MPGAIAPIAGAVVGGLMGGDSGGGQKTASKEPWEPARKPLINSINTGQGLERYYQQNPFNPLQQQGYQNLFADLDMLRSQIAPGMMQFANQMMNSQYTRGPRNSQVEAMQGQMPMQQTKPMMMQQGGDGVYSTKPMQAPVGLMGGFSAQGGQYGPNGVIGGSGSQGMPTGLLSTTGALSGPFQAPNQGNYGLLDFVQLNPFTATNGIPTTPVAEKPVEKTPEQIAEEERRRLQQSGDFFGGGGA